MELCLGTAQFGMQYGVQGNRRPARQDVFEILTYALEHGVYWFDAAAAYGDAEVLLGNYIKNNPSVAGQMKVVSKLDPKALSDVPKEMWKAAVLEHIQASLERLRTESLDAYLLHNAACIFDPDAVEALDSARQAGLAKMIGVSVYTPQEAMQALSYPQIKVIQVPYNVFDRRLDQSGFLKKAKEKKVCIFARSSLLQGLAVMAPERLPDHMQFARPYLERFQNICREVGTIPLHGAISFIACQAKADYLVFGVDNKEQLSEYLSLTSTPLPSEAVDAINAAFGTVPEKLINPSLWKE